MAHAEAKGKMARQRVDGHKITKVVKKMAEVC